MLIAVKECPRPNEAWPVGLPPVFPGRQMKHRVPIHISDIFNRFSPTMLFSVLMKRCLASKHMFPRLPINFSQRVRQVSRHFDFTLMGSFFTACFMERLRLQPVLPGLTFDFCNQQC